MSQGVALQRFFQFSILIKHIEKISITISKYDLPNGKMIFMNKCFLFGGMFLLYQAVLFKKIRKAKLP